VCALSDYTYLYLTPRRQPSNEDQGAEIDEEINEEEIWDALARDPHQLRAETTNKFTDCHNRLKDAEDRFLAALDHANNSMQQKIQNIVEMVVEIHAEKANEFAESEAFVKSKLLENHHREKYFEQKLLEADQMRQAMFNGLMQDVKARNAAFGVGK